MGFEGEKMRIEVDYKEALIREILRSRPMLYKMELLGLKNVTELKSILDRICEGRIL
jgi:hypothetical protein